MRFVRQIATATSVLSSGAVFAHGGHGMGEGTHWHATDVWGLLLVAGLAAMAIYFSRDK